jgi:hypothetical protein
MAFRNDKCRTLTTVNTGYPGVRVIRKDVELGDKSITGTDSV